MSKASAKLHNKAQNTTCNNDNKSTISMQCLLNLTALLSAGLQSRDGLDMESCSLCQSICGQSSIVPTTKAWLRSQPSATRSVCKGKSTQGWQFPMHNQKSWPPQMCQQSGVQKCGLLMIHVNHNRKFQVGWELFGFLCKPVQASCQHYHQHRIGIGIGLWSLKGLLASQSVKDCNCQCDKI